MNKNQHQRRIEAINPNIDQSEIDRKWRLYLEEQERLMIMEGLSRTGDWNAVSAAMGAGILDQSTPAPGPTGPIKFLMLGDGSSASNVTQIVSEITALGYTISGDYAVIGTTYTGATAGITPTNYDVVLYQTNASQTGAVGLNTTLRSYVDAGGHLITSTFVWNLKPIGFDYTLTPWLGGVGQSSGNGNMTTTITHPITNNVATSLTGGATILNNTVTTLQSGATLLATYTTGGAPLVAINTVGSSKLVGLNLFWSGGLGTYTNIRRLVANSILWTKGII